MIDYEHIPHLVQEDDEGETLISVRPHLPSKGGVLVDADEYERLTKDAARWRYAKGHLMSYHRGVAVHWDTDYQPLLAVSLGESIDRAMAWTAKRDAERQARAKERAA
jgi:hypothetical protein